MKIITNDAVYVQKNDIAYLIASNLPIPENILAKVTQGNITTISDSNRYDLVRFEEPEECAYLKKQDWIVDYKDIKDLSDKEIRKMGKELSKERNNIIKEFSDLPENKKIENSDMICKSELISLKILSLVTIIWLREESYFNNLTKKIVRANKAGTLPKKGILYKLKVKK